METREEQATSPHVSRLLSAQPPKRYQQTAQPFGAALVTLPIKVTGSTTAAVTVTGATGGKSHVRVVDNGDGTVTISGAPVVDNLDGTVTVGPPAFVIDLGDGTVYIGGGPIGVTGSTSQLVTVTGASA